MRSRWSAVDYDARLRMTRSYALRESTGGLAPALSAVTRPLDQEYVWDAASNLVEVSDGRLHDEWDEGYRPQRAMIGHDALYRVAAVDYEYKHGESSWSATDTGTDWRGARSFHQGADPMKEEPAPMLGSVPTDRVVSLVYEYDWLANMVEWSDDASAFYERSIGAITNGFEEGERPTALYLSTDLPTSPPGYSSTEARGGWLELDYGEGGNVVTMTVHARCKDFGSSAVCWDQRGGSVTERREHLRESCVCLEGQHYQYRWDELNRLAEARRYDHSGGTGEWGLAVRQRYRYDGANVRTHKETFADGTSDRTVLYAYPGAYERSGVERDAWSLAYVTHSTNPTEAQYLVGGARVVWKHTPSPPPYDLGADLRITYALTDLLGSTSAVLDLWSGELLEVATWYPSGAQETLLNQQDVAIQPEPLGFTGKEADDEVGVVYFGERYLIPRVGRWASPDPLHVHAVGGGEALNSFHYVAGNILQARDPLGLDVMFFGVKYETATVLGGDISFGRAVEEGQNGVIAYEWFFSFHVTLGAQRGSGLSVVMGTNRGTLDDFNGLAVGGSAGGGGGMGGGYSYERGIDSVSLEGIEFREHGTHTVEGGIQDGVQLAGQAGSTFGIAREDCVGPCPPPSSGLFDRRREGIAPPNAGQLDGTAAGPDGPDRSLMSLPPEPISRSEHVPTTAPTNQVAPRRSSAPTSGCGYDRTCPGGTAEQGMHPEAQGQAPPSRANSTASPAPHSQRVEVPGAGMWGEPP